jgi:hypothetical protein
MDQALRQKDARRTLDAEAYAAPVADVDRELGEQVDAGTVEELQRRHVEVESRRVVRQGLCHQRLDGRVLGRTREAHGALEMDRAALDPDPVLVSLDFHCSCPCVRY